MKISLPRLKLALGGLLTGILMCSASALHGQNFQQVAEHLDTDGDFLAFADFSGDSQVLGEHLTAIYAAYLQANPEAMPVPLDFAAIFAQMGFEGIGGIGYSSSHLGDDLYRNRSVSLLKGEPEGLLRIYDLTPRRFRAAEIAPADATLALDLSLEFSALSDTTLQIAAAIMGPMGQGMVQNGLQQPLLPSGLTGRDLITLLSNPITFVARQNLDLGNDTATFEFYAEITGAGTLIDHLAQLDQINPEVTVESVDGSTVVDLSAFTGGEIGFFARSAEGSEDLVIYSGDDFLERIGNGDSLAATPAFQRVAARLPEEAGGFTYQHNPMFEDILDALRGQPEMEPYIPIAEMALTRLLGDFLAPQASAFYEIDGGIGSEAYADYSFKEALVVLPAVVIGGMAAAMSVPAYQKVRQTSQEKAVMNNLRQFASAAQQHMLETGNEEASYDDIVGPGKYIESLEPVAGESYEDLVVTMDDAAISVELGDGRIVTAEF